MKNKKGTELWFAVQLSQGLSFIGDAVEDMKDEEIMEIAKMSLIETKETVKILQEFIDKYNND